jgi:hypothetical protein
LAWVPWTGSRRKNGWPDRLDAALSRLDTLNPDDDRRDDEQRDALDPHRAPRAQGHVGAEPGAGHAAHGEHQSEAPVHVARGHEDAQRRDHVEEHHQHLEDVHLHQVDAQDPVEQHDEQDAHGHLDEAAVEADHRHGGDHRPSQVRILQVHRVPVCRHGHQHHHRRAHHHQDQNPAKQVVAHQGGGPGPDDGARHGGYGELEPQAQVPVPGAAVLPGGRDVLQDDADTVGAVGRGAVQADEHEHRQGDHGTPGGHDVEKARQGARRQQQQDLFEVISG